jgi:hypothetical protein
MVSVENNVGIAFVFHEFLKEVVEHAAITFSSVLLDQPDFMKLNKVLLPADKSL